MILTIRANTEVNFWQKIPKSDDLKQTLGKTKKHLKSDHNRSTWMKKAEDLQSLIVLYKRSGDKEYLNVLTKRIDYLMANTDRKLGFKDQIRNRLMPGFSTKKYKRIAHSFLLENANAATPHGGVFLFS